MEISFDYNGEVLTTQSNDTKEKVKDIFLKCRNNADINSLIFLYSGNEVNGNLIIGKIINKYDLDRKKMNFIITNRNDESKPCWINSKDIICPECRESARIEIKDYKIFFQCTKGGHNIGNIFLNEFENTQKIDISKIICDECKTNNKANSYNNLFYRCGNCKINLCIGCQNKHKNENPTHNFINYDSKNYICDMHNEKYGAYCKTCEKNICLFCKKQHKEHELINFENILPDLNDEKTNIDKLRNDINEFKGIIDDLINRFNKIKDGIEYFYEINKNLFNLINNRNINYEILYSFNHIKNIQIKNDIHENTRVKNINKRIEKLNEIYYKLTSKEKSKEEMMKERKSDNFCNMNNLHEKNVNNPFSNIDNKKSDGSNNNKDDDEFRLIQFGEKYSFECVNKHNLKGQIEKGEDEINYEIIIKNNGTIQWPLRGAKLIPNEQKNIKGKVIILDPLKPGEQKKYIAKFDELKGFPPGNYYAGFIFEINGKKIGDNIDLNILINGKKDDENKKKIEDFRHQHSLGLNEYSDEQLLEVLEANGFDYRCAFLSLID
jgi:hypothetical protein